MNCQHFKTIVIELARGVIQDAATRETGLAHADACACCAARLAVERALSDGLRALAASSVESAAEPTRMETGGAPTRVEAALLASFRQRHTTHDRAQHAAGNAGQHAGLNAGLNAAQHAGQHASQDGAHLASTRGSSQASNVVKLSASNAVASRSTAASELYVDAAAPVSLEESRAAKRERAGLRSPWLLRIAAALILAAAVGIIALRARQTSPPTGTQIAATGNQTQSAPVAPAASRMSTSSAQDDAPLQASNESQSSTALVDSSELQSSSAFQSSTAQDSKVTIPASALDGSGQLSEARRERGAQRAASNPARYGVRYTQASLSANRAAPALRSGRRAALEASTASVEEAEVTTDFFPVSGANSLMPMEGGHVIRVELPRSALVSFGLPMNAERTNERVKADVLLGNDGLARAVRFVR